MYRASTPRHVFYFDIDPDETFKKILITYAQDGAIVLEKTKEDLTFDAENTEDGVLYQAFFQLTQEETRKFDRSKPFVSIQVRMMDRVDNIVTSPIVKAQVRKVLNDEVIV